MINFSRVGYLGMHDATFSRYGLRIQYAAILVCVFSIGKCVAADDYFRSALAIIEQELVTPEQNYGFIMTETTPPPLIEGSFSEEGNDISPRYQETFGIYVSGGNLKAIHHRYSEEFIDNKASPLSREVRVWLDSNPKGVSADIRSHWKNSVGHNVPRVDKVSIGRNCDSYVYYTDPVEGSEPPYYQPVQMLLNPCFAPLAHSWEKLAVTPIELRAGSVTRLDDVEGNRVYEYTKTIDREQCVFRFYFSEEHNHRLSKSVQIFHDSFNSSKELRVGKTMTRKVERWSFLPNGECVPSLWVWEEKYPDGRVNRVARDFRDCELGTVPASHFDTRLIPEFQEKMDNVYDYDEPATFGNYKAARALAPRQGDTFWWIFWINVLVVLFIAVLVAYRMGWFVSLKRHSS